MNKIDLFLQISIYLKAEYEVAALSDVKVFVREDPESVTQTPYANAPTAAFIMHDVDQKANYEFG